MKLRISAALAGLSFALGLSTVGGQQGPPPEEFVPGEILVQFNANSSTTARAAILAQRGGRSLRKYEFLNMERIALVPGRTVEEAVADFRNSSAVVAASPNFIRHKTQAQVAPPNDPFWLSGQLYGLVKISAQQAWNAFGPGNGNIVIADIDTGVNYTHIDLAANMWVNPGETPGNNIDDDNNGYIDDIYGIDAHNNDSNPFDDHGHGTHTSGTLAAVGNNGVGLTGVMQNAKILSCKFISASGSGTDGNAIECFNYIVFLKTQRGINIRVSSNSWGGSGANQLLSNAIKAAGDAGIINIFAAGNDGANNDVTPFYPSSFNLASIVSVASSDAADNRSGFSNYGVTSVDLAAPGDGILSTYFPGNVYATASGTSMATPHVAGAAAYLAGLDPTLSVASIKFALLSTVDVLPQWQGFVGSGGRLNLRAAAQLVGPPPTQASAVFSGSDTTTQGDWPENYGSQGYAIVGDQTSLPSYAQLTPSGHQQFTWASSTSDTRALLRAGGQSRLASTWYAANSFDISVNITDGTTHRVGLYMLDWDTSARSQRIDVLNATTSAVLDTRTVSNFNGGQYLAWTIGGSVKFRVTRLGGSNAVMSGVFFGPANAPPVVALTGPAPGSNFTVGQTVPLAATASDPNGSIASVAFYSNGGLLNTDSNSPYSFNWTNAPAGNHSLTAVATDNLGMQTTSAAVNVSVGGGGGGGPTAAFAGSDASTQGDWPEAYGGDGYLIVADQTSLPAYASVNPIGHQSWTWAPSSSDPRALQRVGGGRVAATWYAATAFDVDVTVSGGVAKQVSLYFVDFDNIGRSQRIDVLNATTLAVLDTRTLSNFGSGQYLVWNVQGNVKFRMTRLGGANTVLSGVFFGGMAPPSPGTAASFIGTDPGTQGNWPGSFGTDGRVIVGDTTTLPAYAQVSSVGNFTWVWDPAPADVRALQRAGGGRVAATWYGQTFDVNVSLSGGQPHEVAIYFLDYDANGRSLQVQVLNAATSGVLDTRTVSNFSSGVYLVWSVTGNVTFRITRLGGANAVLSGIFFAPN